MNSFIIVGALYSALFVSTAIYIYHKRKTIDDMHGMMIGMGLGMLSGLCTATLYLIPTGNFLLGTMIGTFVGLAFGIAFGKLGGHLGLMEGIMSGPMGGMMGAMLGQMMRPFDIDAFMPFFSFVLLISLSGLSYCTHCSIFGCDSKKKPPRVSSMFVAAWIIAFAVLMSASFALSFDITEKQNKNTGLPAYLQQSMSETKATTVIKNGVQEVNLTIENSAYTPNVIAVKKGIPLTINVHAKETAGCGSEIVIPDFKIRKIVAPGTDGVITLTPAHEGTYPFHCSMDMAKGTLIVE